MSNRGIDARQAMEAVNRAVAAPSTLLAEFWRDEGSQAPSLSFIYPPRSGTLKVNLDLVGRNWEIESEFEIGSRRRGIGGLVRAVKRAMRSALRWYVNPIVQQERKFNMLVTRTLYDIGNTLEEIEGRLQALEDRMQVFESAGGPPGCTRGAPGEVEA